MTLQSKLPKWAEEPMRSLYHLSLYSRHLSNGVTIWRNRNRQRGLPPLKFRSGMIWHHGPHDEPLFIMRELYSKQLYDVLQGAPHGAHVIDIGANIGAVTMYWARGRPDLRFHAYEPNPQAYASLEHNIGQNGLATQATIHREAVGRAPGALNLWIDVPTAHSTAFGTSPAPGGRRISAPMIGYDDVWQRMGHQPVHMLKIDAEGAEADILEGASSGALAAVRNAVVEYHDGLVPGAYERCRALLEAAGFACRIHTFPWDEGIIYATRS